MDRGFFIPMIQAFGLVMFAIVVNLVLAFRYQRLMLEAKPFASLNANNLFGQCMVTAVLSATFLSFYFEGNKLLPEIWAAPLAACVVIAAVFLGGFMAKRLEATQAQPVNRRPRLRG